MVCNGSQICFAVFIELIKGLKNDKSGEITKEKEMKKFKQIFSVVFVLT